MIRNKNSQSLLLLVVTMIVVLVAVGSVPIRDQRLSASIPSIRIAEGERVVGFEFHITSGRIVQLADAPIGWSISIDNDPSWNTAIKGTPLVGAAALDPDFFTDFLVIERNESLGLPFEVRGEVVVTRDFTTKRRINIGMRDFVIVNRATQPMHK